MRIPLLVAIAALAGGLIIGLAILSPLGDLKPKTPNSAERGLSSTVIQPPLSLKVELDRPEYRAGDAVKVRLTLTNLGDRPIRLEFLTSQIFDFEISGLDFDYSYKWSSDKFFLQVITVKELGPGGSLQEELEWIAIEGIHNYSLVGMTGAFTVDGAKMQLRSSPVSFRITG